MFGNAAWPYDGVNIMPARIYQLTKNAMQSGRGGTRQWVLEFAAKEARRADPLMGWTGSGDTNVQVKLKFPNMAAAQAYADKQGLEYSILPAHGSRLKLQAYADNFR